MDAQQAITDTQTWARASMPVSELIYMYWEGSDTPVSGDAITVFSSMTTQHQGEGTMSNANGIGALSEIDRLGQACLDAIWAEEAAYGPNREAVLAFMKSVESEDPSTAIARMGNLLGVGEDTHDVIKRSLEIFQKGVERERAVNNYIMARRLLTQAGLL